MSENDDIGTDPIIERLRRADPVAATTPPAPSRAIDLRETIMTSAVRPQRSRTPLLVAAVVVACCGVLVGVLAASGDQARVRTTAEGDGGAATDQAVEPGGALGLCAEMYDLQTLTAREYAFAGTLTAVEGTEGTFAVDEWFTGGDGDTVRLDGLADPGAVALDEVAALQEGERYLVSGSGGFAWGCGFTRTYTDEVAGQWRSAFGG